MSFGKIYTFEKIVNNVVMGYIFFLLNNLKNNVDCMIIHFSLAIIILK